MPCGCPRNARCDRCVDDAFAQLRGVAACRGERWAESVAERVGTETPWPYTPKVRRIAIDKIADLSDDPRLAARLATELEEYAARRWARLRSTVA